jgi:hypothetical protein
VNLGLQALNDFIAALKNIPTSVISSENISTVEPVKSADLPHTGNCIGSRAKPENSPSYRRNNLAGYDRNQGSHGLVTL